MFQRVLALFILAACFNCAGEKAPDNTMETNYEKMPVSYPETKTVDHNDDYHGTAVADPFRWLEIDTAAEVEDWVGRQNEVTFGYLEKIPFRNEIEDC